MQSLFHKVIYFLSIHCSNVTVQSRVKVTCFHWLKPESTEQVAMTHSDELCSNEHFSFPYLLSYAINLRSGLESCRNTAISWNHCNWERCSSWRRNRIRKIRFESRIARQKESKKEQKKEDYWNQKNNFDFFLFRQNRSGNFPGILAKSADFPVQWDFPSAFRAKSNGILPFIIR